MVTPMTIKTFFATVLIAVLLPIAAQAEIMRTIARVYELDLASFQAPATQNGAVTFQECDTCARQFVRVTASTQYRISGRTVRFEDFRRAVAGFTGDRQDVYVGVKHHLESDTVVYVDVAL